MKTKLFLIFILVAVMMNVSCGLDKFEREDRRQARMERKVMKKLNYSWTKTYYRGWKDDDAFDKFGFDGFYFVDTVKIKNSVVLNYHGMSFIGPDSILLKAPEKLNEDILFSQYCYISGTMYGYFQTPYYFLFKKLGSEKYALLSDKMRKYGYDIPWKEVCPGISYVRFQKEPSYYLLALCEVGYWARITVAEVMDTNVPSKETQKYMFKRLGHYCRIAIPVFDD